MDVAFLASSMRAVAMPPPDPWFAGEPINYYYLGLSAARNGRPPRRDPARDRVQPRAGDDLQHHRRCRVRRGLERGRAPGPAAPLAVACGALAAFAVAIAGNLYAPWRLIQNAPATRFGLVVGQRRGNWLAVEPDRLRRPAGRQSLLVPGDRDDQRVSVLQLPPGGSPPPSDGPPLLPGRHRARPGISGTGATARLGRCKSSWGRIVSLRRGGGSALSAQRLGFSDLPVAAGRRRLGRRWSDRRGSLSKPVAVLGCFRHRGLGAVPGHDMPRPHPTRVYPDWRELPVISAVFSAVAFHPAERTSLGEYLTIFGVPYVFGVALLLVVWRARGRARRTDRTGGAGHRRGGHHRAGGDSVGAGHSLCGIPLALALMLLRRISAARRRRAFALVLLVFAWALSIGVEIVYIRDAFDDRMNTLFKFYYQAWTLYAIARRGVGRRPLAGRPHRLAAHGPGRRGRRRPFSPGWSIRWWRRTSGRRGSRRGEDSTGSPTARRPRRTTSPPSAGSGSMRTPGDVVLEAAGCSYIPFGRLPVQPGLGVHRGADRHRLGQPRAAMARGPAGPHRRDPARQSDVAGHLRRSVRAARRPVRRGLALRRRLRDRELASRMRERRTLRGRHRSVVSRAWLGRGLPVGRDARLSPCGAVMAARSFSASFCHVSPRRPILTWSDTGVWRSR